MKTRPRLEPSAVAQFFLSPLLLARGFLPALLSNLLYGGALSYYHYTQFLGYNGAPALSAPRCAAHPPPQRCPSWSARSYFCTPSAALPSCCRWPSSAASTPRALCWASISARWPKLWAIRRMDARIKMDVRLTPSSRLCLNPICRVFHKPLEGARPSAEQLLLSHRRGARLALTEHRRVLRHCLEVARIQRAP